eukprot:4619007-Pyramimonas_sp.AAC.1
MVDVKATSKGGAAPPGPLFRELSRMINETYVKHVADLDSHMELRAVATGEAAGSGTMNTE